MDRRRLPYAIASLALLASCAAPEAVPEAPAAQSSAPMALASPAYDVPRQPQLQLFTIDSYKRDFAHRITKASPDVFHDPLPKMLKSIVVLDVTIGRDGHVNGVAVSRSNGYRELERTAMNNVRRFAPYAVPVGLSRRSDGSVQFMETFLFRDDGRFQVRSIAGPQ